MTLSFTPVKAQDEWVWQNPLPQWNELLDLYVLDKNGTITVGREGALMKTSDRGTHWISSSRNTNEDLRSIRFIDSNTGWIVGGNDILQTTDGGETWVMQEAPSVRIHQYDYKDD